MIEKLEWTQSKAIQNIEQLQNPTIGATINNESATTNATSICITYLFIQNRANARTVVD